MPINVLIQDVTKTDFIEIPDGTIITLSPDGKLSFEYDKQEEITKYLLNTYL
jgi:hypothetical protein